MVDRAGEGAVPTTAIRKMKTAATEAPQSFSGQTVDSNKQEDRPRQVKNEISNSKIKNALQSIADLRRYLLVEHPSLLPTAAPCLVSAEASIFAILDNIQER